ncbi:MAG: lipid-A-disaccharide synthase [SAR86 cluster bacterium]|jgi:lipid-A-disaccharide synthase|nr:lipid-A-disaccharide synthase [SAR86 cluster bacterium]
MPHENIKSKPLLKIGIVAGEKSGDQLGASLIESIKKDFPDCEFIGVGGQEMKEAGLKSFFDLDKISVMGIWEPLKRLPELIKLRKKLKDFLKKNKPDLFIGIDAPDFNLPLAKSLKQEASIKTIQYVSPSVWAWRKGRIKKIEKSVDLMLTLFPFEESSYKDSEVNVKYVGHPLAQKLDLPSDLLNDQNNKNIRVALMPGSRESEIRLLAPLMIEAAKELKSQYTNMDFVMPLVSKDHLQLLNRDEDKLLFIEFTFGNSHEILKKSDYGIITSGTASLEALLLGVPSLVIYKTNWFSYFFIKPFLNISYFSLPNLLSNEEIVPELLQGKVTKHNILKSFKELRSIKRSIILEKFRKIHISLIGKGPSSAKDAIIEFYSKC